MCVKLTIAEANSDTPQINAEKIVIGSFLRCKEFVLHGGHGTIVLSVHFGETVLELKQVSLDDP
jgi:hypothetical protein